MVYANSAYFATLPWDLTVIFGQVVSVDPNNPYVEQRVAVTLSPKQRNWSWTSLAGMSLPMRNNMESFA